jgi:hypothetical protein
VEPDGGAVEGPVGEPAGEAEAVEVTGKAPRHRRRDGRLAVVHGTTANLLFGGDGRDILYGNDDGTDPTRSTAAPGTTSATSARETSQRIAPSRHNARRDGARLEILHRPRPGGRQATTHTKLLYINLIRVVYCFMVVR